MRIRGEFQAAVALRNDHGEEALRLDESPDLRGHIPAPMGDVPVVEHGAKRFARAIQERLFRSRKHRRLRRHELLPIGAAAEQLAVPPHGAGIQGLALRRRHRRQQSAIALEERPRDQADPQRSHIEEQQCADGDRHERFPPGGAGSKKAVSQEQSRQCDARPPQADASIGEREVEHGERQKPAEDRGSCRQRVVHVQPPGFGQIKSLTPSRSSHSSR